MNFLSRRIKIVSSNREKRAGAILKSVTGWDEQYPIPVKWLLGIRREEDLEGVTLLCVSEEDKIFWVKDAISALALYQRAYDLETSPSVLAKREKIRKQFMKD
jgi:hypothetical protein